MSKLLKLIVAEQLIFFIKSYNLFHPLQCAYHFGRSPRDCRYEGSVGHSVSVDKRDCCAGLTGSFCCLWHSRPQNSTSSTMNIYWNWWFSLGLVRILPNRPNAIRAHWQLMISYWSSWECLSTGLSAGVHCFLLLTAGFSVFVKTHVLWSHFYVNSCHFCGSDTKSTVAQLPSCPVVWVTDVADWIHTSRYQLHALNFELHWGTIGCQQQSVCRFVFIILWSGHLPGCWRHE